MNGYTQLSGYSTFRVPTGTATVSLLVGVAFEDGSVVELPAPFLPIGDSLAVTPRRSTEGTALRLDLARWVPARIAVDGVGELPYAFAGQAVAAQAARAFHADPATSWDNTPAEKLAWVAAWKATNGVD